MGRSLHAKIPSTGGALGSTALGIGQFEGSHDNQSHQWKSWKNSDLWCQSWSRVCRTILFQPTHGGLAWCYPCVGTGWSRGALAYTSALHNAFALEVSRLASQEAGHHKSRPDYRLWTYDSYDSYDMTYLNIQDFSGKCNQRHVNLSIYLADSTRHTFGKPWKRSCPLILLTKSSSQEFSCRWSCRGSDGSSSPTAFGKHCLYPLATEDEVPIT